MTFNSQEEPSLEQLLPSCCYNNHKNDRRLRIYKGILTHLTAMIIAIGLCLGSYYYYENVYMPKYKYSIREEPTLVEKYSNHNAEAELSPIKLSNEEGLKERVDNQIHQLKEELVTIHTWRATVNSHLTQMQWEQDLKINNGIESALTIYEADNIGLMDYAAAYAGGLIVAISKETHPHPTHRSLSLFKFVNVDVLSSPDEVIRPCILPGSCFAFRGSSGAVRIKLGRPINIGSVTLSHASRLLLDAEGMSSAPKEFEVYGFTDTADPTGTLLGQFIYEWNDRQHQTFKIKKALSGNQIFEEVELSILSNYGKDEFTCVYRFRVHKKAQKDESTQTKSESSKKKKEASCC